MLGELKFIRIIVEEVRQPVSLKWIPRQKDTNRELTRFWIALISAESYEKPAKIEL